MKMTATDSKYNILTTQMVIIIIILIGPNVVLYCSPIIISYYYDLK